MSRVPSCFKRICLNQLIYHQSQCTEALFYLSSPCLWLCHFSTTSRRGRGRSAGSKELYETPDTGDCALGIVPFVVPSPTQPCYKRVRRLALRRCLRWHAAGRLVPIRIRIFSRAAVAFRRNCASRCRVLPGVWARHHAVDPLPAAPCYSPWNAALTALRCKGRRWRHELRPYVCGPL